MKPLHKDCPNCGHARCPHCDTDVDFRLRRPGKPEIVDAREPHHGGWRDDS